MRRATGQLDMRPLASGEVAVYSRLRVPDPSKPSGYSKQSRLIGRLWTKGGAPPHGFVTKRQAQSILQERIVDAGREAAERPERPSMPTFSDVALAWIRGKSRSLYRSTWTDYDRVLRRHLIPAFGQRRIDKITSDNLNDWKEQAAEEGMSARQIVRCLMVAGQVFGYAIRHHGLAKNPASGRLVPRPSLKYDPSRFHVLSSAQIRSLAAAMPSQHGRAALLVAAWTGVRPGELIELRWRDVAFADQRLHVKRSHGYVNGTKSTKGGRGRSVPMTADVVALLDGLSQRGHSTLADDLILVDEAGDRVASHKLRDEFYAALDAVGLGHLRDASPAVRWYDLRHTFCSMAVKVAPLSDVQAWAGHADVKTTMRYIHSVPAREDAERLAAAFADEPDPLEAALNGGARHGANSRG